VIRALVRQWADAKLREDNDSLVAEQQTQSTYIAGLQLALRNVNAQLEAELLDAASAARSAAQLLASVKQAHAARVAKLEQDLAVLDQANADLSGQLADLHEQLGSYQHAEAIADEARAKRYYDGLGDQ
jgi:cell division protein FtsB